jgi:hypothetical protein
MMKRRRLFSLSLLALACAGHARPDTASAAGECRPSTGRLAANAAWDSLPGSWRLTLVTTFGSMTGRSVQGEMTLRGQDSVERRVERSGPTVVTVPVIGAADIALEDVGARRIGDLHSLEPARPGLAIWVSRGADGGVSAVLRIGQEEIHPTLLQIEGAYTVLYLREVSRDAMRGGWASGVTQEEAHGHFCAERVVR